MELLKMKQVAKIISDIANTSSRNGKLKILTDNKDNNDLLACLLVIFNPLHKTNIGLKKLEAGKHDGKYIKEPTVEVVANTIAHITTGTHADVSKVWSFINAAPNDEVKDLIVAMATQKLSIGITAKSINKAFGFKLIPEFGIMLAEKAPEFKHLIDGFSWIGSYKEDGNRRILVKQNGTCKIYTRTGLPDEGLTEIEESAAILPDNSVYDGEIVKIGEYETSGDTRRATASEANKKGEKTGMKLRLFDMLPYTDFIAGQSKDASIYRKAMLHGMFRDTESLRNLGYGDDDIKQVLDVTHVEGIDKVTNIDVLNITGVYKDYDAAVKDAEKIWAAGGEGIMLLRADAPYELKRTRTLLKLKLTETVDLKVVGFRQGKPDGKYADSLGAIVVSYKGEEVGVSSGLTDYDREQIWNNQEAYLGMIVEVAHLGESTDNTGKLSLFSPKFIRFRTDKEEADA